MISRYTTRQGLAWIDLESPTQEEVASLAEEFGLHPVIANELLSRSERVKVDLYENAVYLILHFPLQNRSTSHIEEVEIDFVLLKNALITTHYELIDPLHDFARLFEVDTYLNKVDIGDHAGFLFFSQIRELYKHTMFLLETVEHDIREIEKHIFNGEETAIVARLSLTNRALIDIKSSLRAHKEMLKSFSGACSHVYGNDFTHYLSAIEGECAHLEQIMNENRETLRDLRNTNDSLLSNKTNMTIKRLTVVNVIMLPLGLITWIFSMHSKLLTIDEPRQLITVFASMVLVCIISVFYFRSKKWL